MARKPGSRHVALSVIAGLLLGLGVALLLLVEGVISINSPAADLLVIGGLALGVVVGLIPARQPTTSSPPTLVDPPPTST